MMKNRILLILLSSILTAAIATACNSGKGEVLVTIDEQKITSKDFENFYFAQNKILLNLEQDEIKELAADASMQHHPTLNMTKFMDNLVATKLLAAKAKTDPEIDQKELEIISRLSELQAMANYYRLQKLKDEIDVTDAEIEAFYNQNREHFRGIPISDELMERIRQQIFSQKFERQSSEFVMGLIAESKVNRDGFRQYLKKKAEEGQKAHRESDTGGVIQQPLEPAVPGALPEGIE